MAFKRFDPVGPFEQLVLTAVHLLHGEGYSVSIHEKVIEIAGRRVTMGACYSSLDRLARKGLIEARFVDPNLTRGAYSKRCFTITPTGVQALAEARKHAQALVDILGEFA